MDLFKLPPSVGKSKGKDDYITANPGAELDPTAGTTVSPAKDWTWPGLPGFAGIIKTIGDYIIASVGNAGNNGRSVGGADSAANAANGGRLNNQLAAEAIANGHAFDKHVIDQNEFGGSITTPQQFANQIENILNKPSAMKSLSNGRSAYWDDSSGMVVIRNPNAADGGTAFKPTNGKTYFDNLR